jgi:hypothetical protein
MDNIVIVLAAVAFFIFQVYSNYKKEQEEAKNRNPANRRPNTSGSPQKEAPPAMEIPRWLEDFLPPQETVMQKPKSVYEKPEPVAVPANEHYGSIDYQPVKYTPSELPADLLKEYRDLPEKKEIEELKRSVAIHKSHSHEFKRLQPYLLIDKVEEEIEVPEFDLREAIIMNAILERPYQ